MHSEQLIGNFLDIEKNGLRFSECPRIDQIWFYEEEQNIVPQSLLQITRINLQEIKPQNIDY